MGKKRSSVVISKDPVWTHLTILIPTADGEKLLNKLIPKMISLSNNTYESGKAIKSLGNWFDCDEFECCVIGVDVWTDWENEFYEFVRNFCKEENLVFEGFTEKKWHQLILQCKRK